MLRSNFGMLNPRGSRQPTFSGFRQWLAIGMILSMALGLGAFGREAQVVQAQPGTLLGTVTLPGNEPSVGGTFDGTHYIAPRAFFGNLLDVYLPPAGGNGAATLVATKTVVDAANNPVVISAITWDPTRMRLWGGANQGNGDVYEIDIGNPVVSSDALATKRFEAGVGGVALLDGIAYDISDDTLYYTPDVDCNVYQFALPNGPLLNTVTPTNAAGASDCLVSGVAIGSGNSLYIGRNGAAEIRRVDKTNGNFISDFATTSGRVEDLVCDPVTYAPFEAILAKDAFNGLYEAFEVEAGTCPLVGEPRVVDFDVRPTSCPNPLMTRERGVLPTAILGTTDLDVSEINVSTVELEGVAPLRSNLEDVATPFGGDISDPPQRDDCTTEGPDGFVDLVLHFNTQAVVAALEANHGPLTNGQVVVVTVTGEMNDGTPFQGQDVVWIIKR